MLAKLCFFTVFVVSVLCNENGRDVRKPRLFSFDSKDDSIRINLEFSIPFVTISSKNILTSALDLWSGHGLPAVNINPSALAIGGAAVLATTIIIPLVVKSLAVHYPEKRYSRLLESTHFSSDEFLELANAMLANSHDYHGCTLRVACWIAQRSRSKSMGNWYQIMRNPLISSMVNSTAVEDAMVSGTFGKDCMMYSPCPINEDVVPILTNSLSVLSNAIV